MIADLSQPVPFSLIIGTIVVIFVIVALGVIGVKKGKTDAKR